MSHSFERFEAAGLTSLTPLLRGKGGGIYILEFADGTQYVGQAVNFVARMTTHVRGGGKHHEPWHDIVAVSVMNVPLGELDDWERRVIEERRDAGITLRNKVFNFGFLGPSALDELVPVDQQVHWATGSGDFGCAQYEEAALRPAGPEPRLFQTEEGKRPVWLGEGSWASRAQSVVMALALIVSQVIPDAPRLEGDYWTLSDNPSTAGGRFATLIVGGLELAFFPRWSIFPDDENGPVDTVVLNLPAGTVLEGPRPQLGQYGVGHYVAAVFPNGQHCIARPVHYLIADTDSVEAPLTDLLSLNWGITKILREFAVDLMRSGNSRKFARYHSAELSRRVYQQVASKC